MRAVFHWLTPLPGLGSGCNPRIPDYLVKLLDFDGDGKVTINDFYHAWATRMQRGTSDDDYPEENSGNRRSSQILDAILEEQRKLRLEASVYHELEAATPLQQRYKAVPRPPHPHPSIRRSSSLHALSGSSPAPKEASSSSEKKKTRDELRRGSAFEAPFRRRSVTIAAAGGAGSAAAGGQRESWAALRMSAIKKDSRLSIYDERKMNAAGSPAPGLPQLPENSTRGCSTSGQSDNDSTTDNPIVNQAVAF